MCENTNIQLKCLRYEKSLYLFFLIWGWKNLNYVLLNEIKLKITVRIYVQPQKFVFLYNQNKNYNPFKKSKNHKIWLLK